jgi:hypothetical protein
MPRTIAAYLTLFAFAFLLLVPAQAQDTPAVPPADPADVETVDAIMAAVYDVISGGQGVARDWDRFRSLFHPNARLIPTGCGQNGCGSRWWSVEEYIATAGSQLEARGFFEVEINRVEERYGQMAHIFSTYESRFDPSQDPFTRGINSFQLWNDGNRWWVFNIYWQGESHAAPIPAEYGG